MPPDDERGVLVRHRQVHRRLDDLADVEGGLAGRARQNLLDDGHAVPPGRNSKLKIENGKLKLRI